MSHGGSRQGAGRTKGVPNKATKERQAKVAAEGITPLDVMIENMRHAHEQALRAEAELSDDKLAELSTAEKPFDAILTEVKRALNYRKVAQACASDAAPYVHPKLATTEVTGKDGAPLIPEATDEQRAQALAVFLAKTGLKAPQT